MPDWISDIRALAEARSQIAVPMPAAPPGTYQAQPAQPNSVFALDSAIDAAAQGYAHEHRLRPEPPTWEGIRSAIDAAVASALEARADERTGSAADGER